MVEYNEVHKIRVTRYPDGNLHYLHFQQLLAFGPGSDENIALCKPCHISSNYHSVVFPASNGNNGTDDFRNFCHSGEEECPFWEVTVDAVVERVVLFNRQDMCGYRLDGSVIQGIDRAGRVLWVVGPMSSDTEFKFIVPPKAPLQCMPRHGRMTGGPGGVFETLVGSSRVYKMEVWCDGNGYAISGIRLSWADGESTSRGQVDNGTRNELELAEDEKILVYKQGAEVSGLISYIWVKTTRKTWSLGNEHQGDRLEVWETSGSGVPIGANIRSSGTGVDAFGLLFLKPERDSDLIYPESSELPSSSSAPRNVGATPPQLEMMSNPSDTSATMSTKLECA
ncbi:hypothetical protein BJ742DRAFT_820054 [Cladochytrium replicatum]|nr:hypothetical protein BJ742DRAFT_820054 [Cladochytrium replicatum]